MKQEKQKSKKINSFVSNIKLPYNINELQWNKEHTQNNQRKYCYCGKDRTLTTLNLQCIQCKNWFHVECLKNKKLIASKSSIVPFMTNYKFICQLCSPKESFEKVTASWKDAINAAFANLSVERLRKEGLINKHGHGISIIPEGYWFDKKDGICPFLDKHWEALCTNRARTPTWWATVGSCMYTSKDNYIAKDEHVRSAASEFILLDRDLFNLRPTGQGVPSLKGSNSSLDSSKNKSKNDKSLKSLTVHKKSNNISEISSKNQKSAIKSLRSSSKSNNFSSSYNTSSHFSSSSTTTATTTTTNQQNGLSRKNSKIIKKGNSFSIKLHEVPVNELLDNIDTSNNSKEHLYNKNGYKYERVEVDNKLKNLIFKKKQEFSSLESAIHLCPFDCDSSISISRNGLTAHSNSGFRMARTNYGVKEGNWYFEIIVNKAGHGIGQQRTMNGPNVRVGWSRREATLHGPVGYDSFSYGYRDKTGEKLHESLPMPYGDTYKSGDVIGCYISLPPISKELLSKKKHSSNPSNVGKNHTKVLSLKNVNKNMIVNSIEDLSPDILSNKRVMHKRKIIKYKRKLYSETNEYLPINLPIIVQYNLKSKMSSSTLDSSSNFEDIKDELMNNIPITSNDFPKLPNSKIVFYKNGHNQGVAFEDLPLPVAASSYLLPEYRHCKFEPYARSLNIYDDGSLGYYPSVSLFKGGSVTLNFGPEFKYPPNDIKENWKPLCDRYEEIQIEETLNDIINEVILEDNKAGSKQKFYVAYNYDTKNNDTTTTSIESIPIKKRKINTINSNHNTNEILDKKRKTDLDEFKSIRSEINTIPKIPEIKNLDINHRDILDNNDFPPSKRELTSINNSFKDNGNKIKNIDNKEFYGVKENEININNKIYNPKLFELSESLENEINNSSTTESSIQSNRNNIEEENVSNSNIKSEFINNNDNKTDNTFEKMDSAIFISQ
ncbi:hypothetical protein BCR36DRAFT_330813 [Piromyces finnis]|uniref:B30.2/SPRY domain-containing protein n=1 Tax=Piromyces finnis TaxID=1754191 RepID=A0A1Y1V6W2_9FUNG|nr:hypothetical protein BCR36DRAFT_330813 [Piromyces finnis]|eukprot:ORX47382.1 hypothetical protein BCR36DRAFT_330813 [Piromyces finnis]